MKRAPVAVLEAAGVAAFLALVGYSLLGKDEIVLSINPEALKAGPADERWMGVFFEDQPIGYSVSSQSALESGGTLHQSRSSFRMVALGDLKEISTAGSAVTTPEGALQIFEFYMSSDLVTMSVKGEVLEDEIVMQLLQGDEPQELRLPVNKPPQMSMSFGEILSKQDLVVGQKLSAPYFDPVSMAQEDMKITVDDVVILPGSAEEAYWITTSFSGMETRRLVTPSGETIREESPMGMSLVRMTREEAMSLTSDSEPVDLIAMASVKVNPIHEARSLKHLVLAVSGIPIERIPTSKLQTIDKKRVTITSPLIQEIPRWPRVEDLTDLSPELLEALQPSLMIPSDHPEIVEQALAIVGGADRREAAKGLNNWVFEQVEKRSVLSVPNGLEVLRTKVGDCNEHTALYVSLARAAGIPAKMVAGLVYSESMGEPGFYYHAWAELQLGGDAEWIPVDPTFGQFPADATHLKLIEGELDKQIEISGLMGQISLRVLKYR